MSDRSRGPNPFTGLNNRGFQEGGYNNKAALDQTVINLNKLFEPSRFEMVGLRYWRDAGNPGFAIVRLDTSESGGQAERHFCQVPTGPEAWGNAVYVVLVAWVETFLEENAPTTQVPTT
jgi:hypothetical protein